MNPAPANAFSGRPRFLLSEAPAVVEHVLQVTPVKMLDQLPRLEPIRTHDHVDPSYHRSLKILAFKGAPSN
jgi:hypothetical protein